MRVTLESLCWTGVPSTAADSGQKRNTKTVCQTMLKRITLLPSNGTNENDTPNQDFRTLRYFRKEAVEGVKSTFNCFQLDKKC